MLNGLHERFMGRGELESVVGRQETFRGGDELGDKPWPVERGHHRSSGTAGPGAFERCAADALSIGKHGDVAGDAEQIRNGLFHAAQLRTFLIDTALGFVATPLQFLGAALATIKPQLHTSKHERSGSPDTTNPGGCVTPIDHAGVDTAISMASPPRTKATVAGERERSRGTTMTTSVTSRASDPSRTSGRRLAGNATPAGPVDVHAGRRAGAQHPQTATTSKPTATC